MSENLLQKKTIICFKHKEIFINFSLKFVVPYAYTIAANAAAAKKKHFQLVYIVKFKIYQMSLHQQDYLILLRKNFYDIYLYIL